MERNKVCQDCLASMLYNIDLKSGARVSRICSFLVPGKIAFVLNVHIERSRSFEWVFTFRENLDRMLD